MKRRDTFCASQASTAICMSMDQPSSYSSSSIQLGGRAIDRHNPIIRDHRRNPRALSFAPCTSQLPPINPQPYPLLQNTKKTSKNFTNKKDKKSSSKLRTSDDVNDVVVRKSWAADFITPPGSSRYLLSENTDFNFDALSDHYDPILALVPSKSTNQLNPKSTSSNSSRTPSNHQVVVLRVSLHCRGCEGKLRKHLSRMEGVRSFSIDFAAKKVTVVGDVTPLGVLASVSKIKSAQFWTLTASDPPLSNTPILNK